MRAIRRVLVRAWCWRTIVRIVGFAVGVGVAPSRLAAGPVFPLRIAAPELRLPADRNSAAFAELDQAFRSFERQRLEECYERLMAARRQRPELPPARLMLARFYLAQNQGASGRSALEQAAAENPDYPGCYLTFGELALEDGRWTDARVHFQKVIELSSSGRSAAAARDYFSIQAQAGLATVAERRRDWMTAQTHFEAWLALDAKNGPARERLARVRFWSGDPDGAYSQLQHAAQADPLLKSAATNMGLLFLEKGERPTATEWLRRAVAQSPKDARTHLELGFCLLSADSIAEAQRCAAAAAELEPNRRELKVLRGLIGMRSGDYAAAEQQYQALLSEFPEDHLARNQLAVALAEQPAEDKRRRAVELAQINTRIFGDAPGALATLGWAYFRVGRTVEAEKLLRLAARDSTNPTTAYFLAVVLIELGQADEAKALLQNALRSSAGEFAFRAKALERLKQLAGATTEGSSK